MDSPVEASGGKRAGNRANSAVPAQGAQPKRRCSDSVGAARSAMPKSSIRDIAVDEPWCGRFHRIRSQQRATRDEEQVICANGILTSDAECDDGNLICL